MTSTNPVIPAEAVEAAMRAQYQKERGRDTWVPYEEMPRGFIERYEEQARLILEAAAPYLQAPAWLDGYRAGECDTFYGENGHEPADNRNPYRSQP